MQKDEKGIKVNLQLNLKELKLQLFPYDDVSQIASKYLPVFLP